MGELATHEQGTVDNCAPRKIRRISICLGRTWRRLGKTASAIWKRYKQREGHCRVPQEYKENGFSLGAWVSAQREAREALSPERKARLDGLRLDWDPLSAQWEEGFDHLKVFKQREGHCRVAQKHRGNGFPLGVWANTQRRNKEKLTVDRRDKLDKLGFVWDPLSAQWEEGFDRSQSFQAARRSLPRPSGI